jgi:putative membrane protein
MGPRVDSPPRPDSASARDHLANERTYLAYIRTALSFVALGFVVARFSLFTREFAEIAHVPIGRSGASIQLGIAMIVIGVALGGFGAYRYIDAYRLLGRTHVGLAPAAAIVTAAIVAAFGAIVAVGLLQLL